MKILKLFEEYVKTKNSYIIPIKDLENIYRYFHISRSKLLDGDGESFTFTTKKPDEPFRDDDFKVIEDDFTKRISLGDTINGCLDSIHNGDYEEELYLYGIDLKSKSDDDIDVVDLHSMMKKCPITKGKKYGADFNLKDWLNNLTENQYKELQKLHLQKLIDEGELKVGDVEVDEIDFNFVNSPSDLPQKYKNLFYACVPDADKTNEFWSLNNLKMDYLGEFEPDSHLDFIYVDENSKIYQKFLKN